MVVDDQLQDLHSGFCAVFFVANELCALRDGLFEELVPRFEVVLPELSTWGVTSPHIVVARTTFRSVSSPHMDLNSLKFLAMVSVTLLSEMRWR